MGKIQNTGQGEQEKFTIILSSLLFFISYSHNLMYAPYNVLYMCCFKLCCVAHRLCPFIMCCLIFPLMLKEVTLSSIHIISLLTIFLSSLSVFIHYLFILSHDIPNLFCINSYLSLIFPLPSYDTSLFFHSSFLHNHLKDVFIALLSGRIFMFLLISLPLEELSNSPINFLSWLHLSSIPVPLYHIYTIQTASIWSTINFLLYIFLILIMCFSTTNALTTTCFILSRIIILLSMAPVLVCKYWITIIRIFNVNYWK